MAEKHIYLKTIVNMVYVAPLATYIPQRLRVRDNIDSKNIISVKGKIRKFSKHIDGYQAFNQELH